MKRQSYDRPIFLFGIFLLSMLLIVFTSCASQPVPASSPIPQTQTYTPLLTATPIYPATSAPTVTVTVTPPNTVVKQEPLSQPASQPKTAPLPLTEIINITPLDMAKQEKLYGQEPTPPFNVSGWHISKLFYLTSSTPVTITLEADVPIIYKASPFMSSEVVPGSKALYVTAKCVPLDRPMQGGSSSEGNTRSVVGNRSNQVKIVYCPASNIASLNGYYVLSMINGDTANPHACRYSIASSASAAALPPTATHTGTTVSTSVFKAEAPSTVWGYPGIKQLGIQETSAVFQQTVSRKSLENPSWDPQNLETTVTALAIAYEATHPYQEPDHVCRHMAMEFWQVLKDKGISSLIAVGNPDRQKEWRLLFQCDHAWIIVLGKNGLNLGVECTSGKVYSPGYMRLYEQACELASAKYGQASSQWRMAKADYDREYLEYAQHLEAYLYLTPGAFKGSALFFFAPGNW